jgi:hypothetical protein
MTHAGAKIARVSRFVSFLRPSAILLLSFWAVHKEVFENVIAFAPPKRTTAFAADDFSVPRFRSCLSANKIVFRTASRALKAHRL